MNTTITDFQRVIAAFDAARSPETGAWGDLCLEFRQAFEQSRGERALYTPHLNVLEIFGLKLRELRHSDLLAWFLKENETHEQGSLFLGCLVKHVGLELDQPGGYTVQRESPDNVDVAVFKNGGFAIFIENKVEHHETEGQIEKLINAVVKFGAANRIPERHRVAVFLTDDGRSPVMTPAVLPSGFLGENLFPVRRTSLVADFSAALEGTSRKSPLLTNLVTSYLETIHTHPGART